MHRIGDYFSNVSEKVGQALGEIILTYNMDEIIKVFSDFVEEVKLHFSMNEETRGYYKCLGKDCPACKAGIRPSVYCLLPVYNVAQDAIQVLRMSVVKGPRKIFSLVMGCFDDPKIYKKLVKITRDGRSSYKLEVFESDRAKLAGVDKIKAFLDTFDTEKSNLTDIYPLYSVDEVKDMPDVSRRLGVHTDEQTE